MDISSESSSDHEFNLSECEESQKVLDFFASMPQRDLTGRRCGVMSTESASALVFADMPKRNTMSRRNGLLAVPN